MDTYPRLEGDAAGSSAVSRVGVTIGVTVGGTAVSVGSICVLVGKTWVSVGRMVVAVSSGGGVTRAAVQPHKNRRTNVMQIARRSDLRFIFPSYQNLLFVVRKLPFIGNGLHSTIPPGRWTILGKHCLSFSLSFWKKPSTNETSKVASRALSLECSFCPGERATSVFDLSLWEPCFAGGCNSSLTSPYCACTSSILVISVMHGLPSVVSQIRPCTRMRYLISA
jgi:hypothetical protein